jgi:hypothetical protein
MQRRTKKFLSIGKNVGGSLKDEILDRLSDKNSFERRQRIRLELEELEDEDFMMVDARPKTLIHERDFFRQATRVQAWDEYVLVSILCTSISYGALQTFQLNPDHEGIFFYETILKVMIQIVAGFSVLSGLYSTMVFALSILYGRTACKCKRSIDRNGMNPANSHNDLFFGL